jgi:hypothetical protein
MTIEVFLNHHNDFHLLSQGALKTPKQEKKILPASDPVLFPRISLGKSEKENASFCL